MYYFITFRTYGTWLHGDERGSVDRAHNQVGTELLAPDANLERYRRQLMKSPPVHLDGERRACVESTLREVATHRGWAIHALNVLSNHVHVVVETDETPENAKPEKALNDFKAWATRRLRESGSLSNAAEVWEHHGSTRYLKTEEAVASACHYVLNCQDE
jgi:REP element-mobilizing transposase RayT